MSWLMNSYLKASRQTIGSSEFWSRKAIEATLMLYAWNGMMPPVALILSFCPSPPTILGMLGPWMSISATPTSLPRSARLTARFVVTVLLPTPPLLLMTRILLRMTDIRLFTSQRLCPSLSFRSEEHTSELQSRLHLVCRLLLEKKKKQKTNKNHKSTLHDTEL